MESACGVRCSECPAYKAAARGAEYRSRVAEAWSRIYGLVEPAERIHCGGCLGPEDQVFHTSRACKARLCCRARALRSCAECALDACPDLEHAQSVWDGVPRLENTISAADFEEYARPYCGHRQRLAEVRARRAAAGNRSQ